MSITVTARPQHVLIALGGQYVCLPRAEALELANKLAAALRPQPDHTLAQPGKARLMRYRAGEPR